MSSGDTNPKKACDIPRASPIHADNQKFGSYNDYNWQHLVEQCKTPVTLTSASFKIDPGSKKKNLKNVYDVHLVCIIDRQKSLSQLIGTIGLKSIE